jgi:hypothetical protein
MFTGKGEELRIEVGMKERMTRFLFLFNQQVEMSRWAVLVSGRVSFGEIIHTSRFIATNQIQYAFAHRNNVDTGKVIYELDGRGRCNIQRFFRTHYIFHPV